MGGFLPILILIGDNAELFRVIDGLLGCEGSDDQGGIVVDYW